VKVVYVRVRPYDPEEEDFAWAVLLNNCFIATDSPHEMGPTCGEIAQDLADVLGVEYEERVVEVPDRWSWEGNVLPQVRDGAPGGLFVTYVLRYGEDETLGYATVELNPGEEPEDAVHQYFRDFFGNDTVCEKKAVEYWRADECAVLKVSTWREVPPHELAVLKKYL
jgi:hypothetical protein